MKILPILITVGLLATTYFTLYNTATEDNDLHFANYMTRFNRNYQSESEYNFRKSIFDKNLAKINAHNAKGLSWTNGVNEFTDWTDEEYKTMLGYGKQKDYLRSSAKLGTIKSKGIENLESIDHVKGGLVTPVKNQGACGSCWAFSTLAAMEGAYAKEHKTLESFSEAHLVECDGFSGACGGGWSINGLLFFTKRGPILEKDYPYRLPLGTCEESEHKAHYDQLPYAFRVEDDEDSLYEALKHNVVSVAIRAENDDFRSYTGGVIDGDACGTELDHAVTLVGYEASTDSWVVKNSWGSSWGESGYVRIRRREGKGVCGINQDSCQAVMHRSDY